MEELSLAQFVANFTKNSKGDFYRRKQQRIIRYRNYDIASDINEYKREMVTLHIPFRNEEFDILEEMKFIRIYDENENQILERRKEFESDLDINKTIELCRKLCRENEEADDDDEIHDIATRIPEANPFQTLYDNPNSDVNSDLRIATLNKLGAIAKRKENLMPNDQYYENGKPKTKGTFDARHLQSSVGRSSSAANIFYRTSGMW